nr:ATP-binding protein [Maliibacterium massiliense]
MKEIALHILDIVQNSIVAEASLVTLTVAVDTAADTLDVIVQDNGRGMDASLLARVRNPFVTTRTTRKVGLGIPLLMAGCERTGGFVQIDSAVGEGTRLHARYVLSNIDRPPLGDMPGTMASLVLANPHVDFVYLHRVDARENLFDTRQIRQVLGEEVPLDTPEVALWIAQTLKEGLDTINGGVASL